jgi:hypothetical protein
LFNSRIWIKTCFAWYILDEPSQEYQRYYERTYIVHVFACLILQAIRDDPECTIEDFKLSLSVTSDSSTALVSAVRVLGRRLTVDDLFSPNIVCVFKLHVFMLTFFWQHPLLVPKLMEDSISKKSRQSSLLKALTGKFGHQQLKAGEGACACFTPCLHCLIAFLTCH